MGWNGGGRQGATYMAPPACASDGANPIPPRQSVNGPVSHTSGKCSVETVGFLSRCKRLR